MTLCGPELREESAFQWRQEGDEIIAEYPGLFALRATADGVLKTLDPAPHLRAPAIDKLRHGFAAAFLRSFRGGYSLHASAVANDRGALLCVGPSGSGKSTLAEHLCRVRGVRLLADDIAGVERREGTWKIVPSESVHWVDREGSGQKAPIPSRAASADPVPVLLIASLRFDDTSRDRPSRVSMRSLRGADIIANIISASLRFRSDPTAWLGELDALTSLCSRAKYFEITRTRNTPATEVVRALLTEMAGTA